MKGWQDRIVAYRVTVRGCRASDPPESQPLPPWDTLIVAGHPLLIYLLIVANHNTAGTELRLIQRPSFLYHSNNRTSGPSYGRTVRGVNTLGYQYLESIYHGNNNEQQRGLRGRLATPSADHIALAHTHRNFADLSTAALHSLRLSLTCERTLGDREWHWSMTMCKR